MIEKKRIKTRKFQEEDLLLIVGNTEVVAANARLNAVAGPAYSVFIDGKLVGCGGLRIHGVGEAWFAAKPQPKERMWDVVNITRTKLDDIIRQQSIWRVYAEPSPVQERPDLFLKRLGFEEKRAFIKG